MLEFKHLLGKIKYSLIFSEKLSWYVPKKLFLQKSKPKILHYVLDIRISL